MARESNYHGTTQLKRQHIDYRPRLSIDITSEQRDGLKNLVPWGCTGDLFRCIIDDLLEILQEPGKAQIVIGVIMTRSLHLREWSKTMKECDTSEPKGPQT